MMGYSLHIVRSDEMRRDFGGIPLDDGLAYCDIDPELTPVVSATSINPATGEEIVLNGTGFVVFEPADIPANERPAVYFHWSRGTVSFDSKPAHALTKAVGIADALGARVTGDEGEFYRADGSHYYE